MIIKLTNYTVKYNNYIWKLQVPEDGTINAQSILILSSISQI